MHIQYVEIPSMDEPDDSVPGPEPDDSVPSPEPDDSAQDAAWPIVIEATIDSTLGVNTQFSDKAECRICLDDTSDEAVVSCCACNSVVHRSCLDRWRRINRRSDLFDRCELCMEPYTCAAPVTPVHEDLILCWHRTFHGFNTIRFIVIMFVLSLVIERITNQNWGIDMSLPTLAMLWLILTFGQYLVWGMIVIVIHCCRYIPLPDLVVTIAFCTLIVMSTTVATACLVVNVPLAITVYTTMKVVELRWFKQWLHYQHRQHQQSEYEHALQP